MGETTSNPYLPAIQGNAEAAARRQLMAQRLMAGAPAPTAMGSYAPPTVAQGGSAGIDGRNPLGGIDMSALRAAFAPKPQEPGVPGIDGYHNGYGGTGGLSGTANTGGADALQQLGFYNPLPAS